MHKITADLSLSPSLCLSLPLSLCLHKKLPDPILLKTEQEEREKVDSG